MMDSVPTIGEAWLWNLNSIIQTGLIVQDNADKILEVCNYSATMHAAQPDVLLDRFADQDRISLMLDKYDNLGVLPQYTISYGALLYDNEGVDQISWIVDKLKRKRETKSATITLHHPGDEELSCLSLLDFKIRLGRLSLSAFYRSQNAFSSNPGNMLAMARIQSRVAEAVGAQVGVINLVAASSHIYEQDIPAALDVIARASEGDCA